jgi:hypothetical protein
MIMNYLTTTALAAALFASPTLARPLPQPRPAAVEYDARRCAVTLSAGDVHVRFSSLYAVEFDAMNAEFKPIGDIARVQIDQTTFALHPGQAFEYSLGSAKEVLPVLARGQRLQVFADGKNEPVIDMPIRDGKKAVAFLRKCGTRR